MTSKEICEILKASKGTGVKEIKIDKILIKFDNLTNQGVINNTSTIAIPNNSTNNVVEDVKYLTDEQDDGKSEEIKDEFAMANLMASDPEAFEKYQRNL